MMSKSVYVYKLLFVFIAGALSLTGCGTVAHSCPLDDEFGACASQIDAYRASFHAKENSHADSVFQDVDYENKKFSLPINHNVLHGHRDGRLIYTPPHINRTLITKHVLGHAVIDEHNVYWAQDNGHWSARMHNYNNSHSKKVIMPYTPKGVQ